MQLFFGTMKGNRYVLEIGMSTTRGEYKSCEADFRMADKDGNYVLSFTRTFTNAFDRYSTQAIKRAMLATAREDLK